MTVELLKVSVSWWQSGRIISSLCFSKKLAQIINYILLPCDSVTRPAVQTNLFCYEKVSIMLMNLGDVYATCKRFESLCKEENWQKTSIKSSLSSKIESNTPSSSFSCKWIFTWKDKVSYSLSNMLWKNNTVLWNDGSSPRAFQSIIFYYKI